MAKRSKFLFQSPSNRVNIPNAGLVAGSQFVTNPGFNPLVIGSIFQTSKKEITCPRQDGKEVSIP